MERANIIRYSLTAFVLISIVLAMAMPAWAQGAMTADDQSAWDQSMGGPGKAPEDMYMTIAVDGMIGSTANFAVMNLSMKGADDKAVLIKPGAPLAGTYNTSSDMGYISMANFMPATMTVNTANNTSLPVAEASAVMGLHGMKVLAKEKGYKVFQFDRLSFFMPNGSVLAYKLDRPVRVTSDEDRKLVVIDAYPSFTRRLAEALRTGTTFPAGAPPVPLNSLALAKSAALAEPVGYEKPEYVAPPT
jgi:hypothetical protein